MGLLVIENMFGFVSHVLSSSIYWKLVIMSSYIKLVNTKFYSTLKYLKIKASVDSLPKFFSFDSYHKSIFVKLFALCFEIKELMKLSLKTP